MSERLTLAVQDGTRAHLIELAGSERKIGAVVSVLAAEAVEVQRVQRTLSVAVWDVLQRVDRLEAAVFGGEDT